MKTPIETLKHRSARIVAQDVLFEYLGAERWVALERIEGHAFAPAAYLACSGFAVKSELRDAYMTASAVGAWQVAGIEKHLVEVLGWAIVDGALIAPRWMDETKEERRARSAAEHALNELLAVELPAHDIDRAKRLASELPIGLARHRERWSNPGTRKAAFWALTAAFAQADAN